MSPSERWLDAITANVLGARANLDDTSYRGFVDAAADLIGGEVARLFIAETLGSEQADPEAPEHVRIPTYRPGQRTSEKLRYRGRTLGEADTEWLTWCLQVGGWPPEFRAAVAAVLANRAHARRFGQDEREAA